jgi:muramidase (phage lysozyme)
MDRSIPPGAALLLEFIYETETSRKPPQCYEVIYANKQGKLPKPLTKMTLDEVISSQRRWSKNHGSSAAGAPQFMRNTLLGLLSELGLAGSQILDGNLQDRLAFHLLKRRGYEEFIAGEITRIQFGKRLAQEWASFPVLAPTKGAHRDLPRGVSYYEGDSLNKALGDPETVEAVLDRVKAVARASVQPEPKMEPIPQPEPVIVEKPVVVDPGELEKHPAKSKTVWQWIITTVLVPVLAVVSDWRVQLAIVLIIAAFASCAIKRRVDLFQAVKKALNSELGQWPAATARPIGSATVRHTRRACLADRAPLLAGVAVDRRGAGLGNGPMFPLNWLSAGAGALVATAATFGAMSAWTALVTVPAVKAETRALAEAEAARRTETAINEVSSDAEKARFMRRYCRDLGRLYDFERNTCRDA